MGFMSPKVPKPAAIVQPAERPDRVVEVEPEDVQMGDKDSQATTKTRGKRALMRPTGASGLSV